MDKYIKSPMRLFMIVAILGISGIFSDAVAQEPMAEVAAETLVDTPTLDSGNTAWIMVATILVFVDEHSRHCSFLRRSCTAEKRVERDHADPFCCRCRFDFVGGFRV